MAKGALVLVVGPSGAGKDTLIGAAKAALADDHRFTFPRRVVTRAAMVELEDHDSVDVAEFQKQKLRGAYALDWEAHGLCYGVPAAIDSAMVAGRVVVVNTSRRVVERAIEKYPSCYVLLVTARPEIRAARLASRGRETAGEVEARLAREGAPVPDGVDPIVIDNSSSLEAGVGRFVGALRSIAG
jgi:phosphonate metabolism protein PhnN/1,5-bisphosphokinase (PRPP-forming)